MRTKNIILLLLALLTFFVCTSWTEKLYWRYYPFVPAEIHGITIQCPHKEVYPGEDLVYEVDTTRNMDIVPTIHRQLRNTYVYTLSPIKPPIRPLGRQKITATLPVPRSAEYGKYVLLWSASFPVGPEGRIVTVTATSDEFRVVPRRK